ncbi:DNA-3-methyladenine glycosylase I [Candidiatus Paracoxiella cheracis]|uniref:DNA-3-methyladenine glycosylase I n=1 Tax=Candidiatus Paracoxiella cheracis TaxID=3405120 RepID=UPI003BF483A2
MKEKQRCQWCGEDSLYTNYHDKEWGVPVRNDQTLFEFLILEGMQAGLSWLTILKKRENFRKAFSDFNPEKIVRFTEKKIEKLMQDSGIIRNRLKILAVIANAKAYLDIVESDRSFSDYLWQFTNGKPIKNAWKTLKQIPAETKESQAMSKELKRRGFKFVGPTICYAHMQATGMVNDHVVSCFRYDEV